MEFNLEAQLSFEGLQERHGQIGPQPWATLQPSVQHVSLAIRNRETDALPAQCSTSDGDSGNPQQRQSAHDGSRSRVPHTGPRGGPPPAQLLLVTDIRHHPVLVPKGANANR